MKKKIICSGLVFILVTFLQIKFLARVSFKSSVISDIVTFLSITFGFYITSLAIFVTSQYVAGLYKITDQKNRTFTLLNTLTNNYKFGLSLTLLSLVYFIAIQFFIGTDQSDVISFSKIILSPISGLLLLNFFFCFIMLNDLIKIIVQEAKTKT